MAIADGIAQVMGLVIGLLMRAAIRAYQLLLAPVLPPACRYVPSCSHYAEEAIAMHGPLRGGLLAARRLCRCHPWGGAGFDPVPVGPTPVDLRPGNLTPRPQRGKILP